MKVIAQTIIAYAVAKNTTRTQWNGYAPLDDFTRFCGEIIDTNETMVDRDCTFTGSNIHRIYAGNGAIVSGPNTFTGMNGTSGDFSVVIEYWQNEAIVDEFDMMDNNTCWDFQYECVDRSEPFQDLAFLWTVNREYAMGGYLPIQVVGYKNMTQLTFEFVDSDNFEVPVWNATSHQGTITQATPGTGFFSLEVFDNAADVLQIELLVDGHPDLLLSTVTGA